MVLELATGENDKSSQAGGQPPLRSAGSVTVFCTVASPAAPPPPPLVPVPFSPPLHPPTLRSCRFPPLSAVVPACLLRSCAGPDAPPPPASTSCRHGRPSSHRFCARRATLHCRGMHAVHGSRHQAAVRQARRCRARLGGWPVWEAPAASCRHLPDECRDWRCGQRGSGRQSSLVAPCTWGLSRCPCFYWSGHG